MRSPMILAAILLTLAVPVVAQASRQAAPSGRPALAAGARPADAPVAAAEDPAAETAAAALAAGRAAAQRDAQDLARAVQLRLRERPDRARELAHEVLDRSPDHAMARVFLGHTRLQGRWRLPAEVVYLERAARNAGTPERAAPTPEDRRIQQQATAALAQWEAAILRTRPRARTNRATVGHRGLAEVRLQHTRLLGIDTVPVGFGNGTGRLQLPRTETISIGGLVPIGR